MPMHQDPLLVPSCGGDSSIHASQYKQYMINWFYCDCNNYVITALQNGHTCKRTLLLDTFVIPATCWGLFACVFPGICRSLDRGKLDCMLKNPMLLMYHFRFLFSTISFCQTYFLFSKFVIYIYAINLWRPCATIKFSTLFMMGWIIFSERKTHPKKSLWSHLSLPVYKGHPFTHTPLVNSLGMGEFVPVHKICPGA